MSGRDSLGLLLVFLLVAILLGCVLERGGDYGCDSLWCDCPGTVNDYEVHPDAADLEQEVRGEVRYFSYVNCASGKRTPTLSVAAECHLSFRY